MSTELSEKTARREAKAVGPCWVGQVVDTNIEDDNNQEYTLVWLPDRNNDLLKEAGKPMHFYYLPAKPRLAQDADGNYLFHLQKFSGIMDPTKNIGEDGFDELTGGCLTFTSTLGVPEQVLAEAFDRLKNKLFERKDTSDFFGLLKQAPTPINGGPVALTSSETSLHKVSTAEGASSANESGNPDDWTFQIQGAGEGALNIQANNAYTVMLGNRPVQMLLDSVQSGTSQITVAYDIRYAVWTLVTEIKITAEWEHVYDHFSMNFKSKNFIADVDYKKEVNEMISDGVITVEVNFGAGMVDAKQQETYEKSADVVADTFMKQMKDELLQAAKVEKEEAAEADDSGIIDSLAGRVWWYRGSAFSMKDRKDITEGSRTYVKKINKQVEKSERLSSQMEGLFDEISENAEAKDRYLSEVFFEEGFKKIHVVANANAHWGSNGEVADPINSMKLQVGYPDSKGNIVWKSNARFKDGNTDKFSDNAVLASWDKNTKDRQYVFDFTKHDDLENADQIHVKEIISLQEQPNVAANEVSREVVTNEHIVEVRAESLGKLHVGPISLDMPIGTDQVDVLVHLKTDTFGEEVLTFDSENEDTPQHYTVWYASPEEVENYKYKVEVVVKGKSFGQRSIRWEGDWNVVTGSGPLIVEVPPIPTDMEEKVNSYLGA